jgi:hypothetical protein
MNSAFGKRMRLIPDFPRPQAAHPQAGIAKPWIWLGCLTLLLAPLGCSKKPEPPPAKAPGPAAVSVSAEPEAPAAAKETKPEDAEFPNPGLLKPGTINEDGVEVGAAALTDALQNYYYATAGQVPESLEHMIKLKIIGRIPTPPPGKKYVLDRKKAIVTLQNAR